MEYVITPRNGGKTTTLLRRREETGGVIIVSTNAEKEYCQNLAKKNGWSAEGIFSLSDFNNPTTTAGWAINLPIYVDNVDAMFKELLYDVVKHPSIYDRENLVCSVTSEPIYASIIKLEERN